MALAAGIVACEDADCDLFHIDNEMMGIPTVMQGSFPVGKLTPAIGDSVVFAPRLMDTTGVKYSWMLNGEEVSTDSAFVYRVEKPCRAKITCTLENPKGKVTLASSIVADYDLMKGILLVQNNGIDLYDAASGVLYQDVYASMNYGKGLRLGSYDDLCVLPNGDKLYAMKSTSTSNTEHLFVIDRKTLNEDNSAVIEANVDAFFLLDGRQALVAAGGVSRIDLLALSKTRLLKKYGSGIYNGLVFQGKLLANTTNDDLVKLSVYDKDELLQAKEGEMPLAGELDIWQNGKVNFVKLADGNVYTLGCNADASEYYIVRIAPDFSLEKTLLPFTPWIGGFSSGFYTASLTSDKNGNILYVMGENGSVYQYVPGDASSLAAPLIGSPAGDLKVCGSGVNVNPANGELWVCYFEEIDYEDNGKIVVYDAGGKQLRSIDCGKTKPQTILFP